MLRLTTGTLKRRGRSLISPILLRFSLFFQIGCVKAEQLELEIDRKRDAAQLYGHHYDLITVDGKLSVKNFQQKTITLEITKTLSGELKSSQPETKIEKLARGLRRMNTVLKLTWAIELEPGQQKKLGYIYDVYVRR